MNKQSNTYIITYASIMVVVVATVLSLAAIGLRDVQQRNVEIEMMGSILGSVNMLGDITEQSAIVEKYNQNIKESFFVNNKGEKVEATQAEIFASLNTLKSVYAMAPEQQMLPVFVSSADGKTNYILPIYGAGLWGPIWGYVALKDDFDSVEGIVLDHKSETPGLGAEISTPAFENQYIGKTLFDGDSYVGIGVTKGAGSSAGNDHAVDAISGGTITSRGVESMVKSCLKDYVPFLEKMKGEASVLSMDNSEVK